MSKRKRDKMKAKAQRHGNRAVTNTADANTGPATIAASAGSPAAASLAGKRANAAGRKASSSRTAVVQADKAAAPGRLASSKKAINLPSHLNTAAPQWKELYSAVIRQYN